MKKRILVALLALLLVAAVTLPAVMAAEQSCDLCGEAEWTAVSPADWAAGKALTTGHYKLTADIEITAALTIAAGEQVCIDLAGYDLTQTTTSTAKSYLIRVIENSGKLTIMDSAAKTVDGEYVSGVISGGYCYAAESVNTTYGGNIYNTADSEFNLYGGTISGGTVQRKYHSTKTFGGGNIYSEGIVNIHGGALVNGKAWGNLVGGTSTTSSRQTYVSGGNLYMVGGELNITAGIIRDGQALNESYGRSAPGTYYAQGGNICVDSTNVTIDGGLISGGTAIGNNKGADSASGTEVISKALGGNICITGKSYATINGGTFTGGMVDNSVVPVDGKTLTEGSCFPFGGNIFGSSNSTVRIFGGVITKGTAYKGGGVYSGGKLTISGGEFSECVAVLGSTQNADNYGGSVYSEDTLSITGGTLIGGTAKRGGNVFANKNFTMTGGTLKGGVATDRGGNLTTMNGTLNITNCTISEGSAPRYGGNVYCAENLYFYNGSITNPVSGHNVTVMSNANAYIYGGSIYDGEFGSGIYAYDGSSAGAGNVYVYGGSVVSIASGNYGSNNIHIYNGFVGNITNLDGKTLTLEQMDANADGLPVVPECAHITIEGGYVVWHHFEGDCDKCGHTYGSAPCEACSATHQLPTGGTHTYEVNPDTGVAACIYCGLSLDGKVCAAIEGEYYSDLEEALSAGKAMGKTVKLIKDLEIENLNLYTTLDLAGYTLTVTGVLGAENKEATITDSVGTGGIIGKLFTHADNAQVPVLVDGVWKLERVALTQTIETINEDEQKLKFVITDGTEDTLLDEATVNGDEYKIRIQVQWTEAGQQKVHYFRYNAEMVKEYASAWGEKMYTCTITGLTGMEKVKITAQLVSGGVVVSAKDITPSTTTSVSRYESGDGYTAVSNILSWEKINSFPIKNDSMTVREMRELCVDYYNYSKTFNWVSNEDNNYEIGAGYGIGSYQQNNVYGGFAYVSLGTGNMYRFMDFMDERTGVVNINEANKYPTLFGNQCSQSAYYAWGRFVNSLKTSIYTLYMVEKNGYLPVGPYTYDTSIDEFSEEYGTGKIIEDNGEEVIYESYACLQLADGLVRKFPGGHTVMVCSDPVVVRDENGKIDPGKSYIIASDQTASWTTGTNAQGDSYAYTKNVKVKWTFSYMIEKGYLPFTFGEFLGTDPVEETVISYSHEGATISREQLFGSTVTANYEILDIYAVFTDAKGNEVCKIANRTQNPFTMVQSFDMDAQREGVPGFVRWGDLDSVPTDGSVTVEIIAQLTTGERPTLWEGAYVA